MTQTLSKTLATRLQAASDAYYNGTPTMSDAAFDTLRDDLEKLDPNHPFLKVVGAPVTGGGWQKVKHQIPMGSQFKAQTSDDMAALPSCPRTPSSASPRRWTASASP